MNFTKEQLKEIYNLHVEHLKTNAEATLNFQYFLKKTELYTGSITIYDSFRNEVIDYTQFSEEKIQSITQDYFYNLIDNLQNTTIHNIKEQISVIPLFKKFMKAFCQREENKKLIVDFVSKDSDFFQDIHVLETYISFVDYGWINPFKDTSSESIFKDAIYQVMKAKGRSSYKDGLTKPLIDNLQDTTLIVAHNICEDIEFKKELFCKYVQVNQLLDLSNKNLKEIHEQYKKEDFSKFYSEYNEIKSYYEDSDSDIVYKQLKVSYYKYIVPKIIENGSIINTNNPDSKQIKKIMAIKLSSSLSESLNVVEEKKSDNEGIINIQKVIGKEKIEVFITHEENNEKIENFLKTYEMFIDNTINKILEDNQYSIVNKRKDWEDFNLFSKMDNQIKEKHTTKSKKKV